MFFRMLKRKAQFPNASFGLYRLKLNFQTLSKTDKVTCELETLSVGVLSHVHVMDGDTK